jgi:plasmid stabilization system protein ParE
VTGRVEFTPEASEDVAEAFSWYEGQQLGLGREFETHLDRAIAVIRAMPAAGSPVHRTLRRCLLGRFPFAVYYALEGDVIVVRAVLHHRRDPRTWRRRA